MFAILSFLHLQETKLMTWDTLRHVCLSTRKPLIISYLFLNSLSVFSIPVFMHKLSTLYFYRCCGLFAKWCTHVDLFYFTYELRTKLITKLEFNIMRPLNAVVFDFHILYFKLKFCLVTRHLTKNRRCRLPLHGGITFYSCCFVGG